MESLNPLMNVYLRGKLLKLLEGKGINTHEEIPLTAKKIAGIFVKHRVALAYLFGSRARRTARKDSDYAIAVLFQSGDVTVLNEIELARDLASALRVPADRVDVVALNKAGADLVARVLKERVLAYSMGDEERKRWERNAYLDLLRRRDLDAVYIARTLRKARHS
ncbi:MAG: type VII toxin-antitoxin system MntA family adenylyltransferase antitoxin [Nitrososphaerales archaeon]